VNQPLDNLNVTPVRVPELLAPAGNMESLRAGVNAGADAVYLGVNEGFNARARADNFSLQTLPDAVRWAHRGGTRVFVTLNTLIFQSELTPVSRVIELVAAAGVDALIVQDPAVALIAREVCPELELHASTQMTVSSAEAAPFAARLGCNRVVVPRELSIEEIRRYAAGTDIELEVFIHGALCMAWSGQCLSSEAWGGRSANRGQCAQACRMPYELIVDNEHRPTGDLRYFLSPRDLAGYAAIPALMEIGVHSLKVEGRLKGPAYVMSVIGGLRRWIDAIAEGRANDHVPELRADVGRMSIAYSRGFSPGFFGGSNHQHLVEGTFPRHRGRLAGRVVGVSGDSVRVERWQPEPATVTGMPASTLPAALVDESSEDQATIAPLELIPGMGAAFDTDDAQDKEAGGVIFEVTPSDNGWTIAFRNGALQKADIRPGHRVWITGDHRLSRDAEKLVQLEPTGQIPLTLSVSGSLDQPLTATATASGSSAHTVSAIPLTEARGTALDTTMLTDKLGALGGTTYHLAALDDASLTPGLFLPPGELKRMRRALVEDLDRAFDAPSPRLVRAWDASPEPVSSASPSVAFDARDVLVPLCRTDEQLDAVIEAGLPEVELDWMELVGLAAAVKRARAAGLRVVVATVRVQKPGESGIDARIARLNPDGVLVRHWAGLEHFASIGERGGLAVHGDFSLNVTNSLTANHVLALGLDTLTVAHDLDATQADALLNGVDASRMAVTVHHHIPTFHTEHCVYAHQLSDGRDFRTCGRPCDEHRIALRDHQGREHPVLVDVGCRNTVFNAAAQSAAGHALRWTAMGVRRLRVEFVWENRTQTALVLQQWLGLLAGDVAAAELTARVGTHEQFGVTSGTMRVMS
jgi:putative protease